MRGMHVKIPAVLWSYLGHTLQVAQQKQQRLPALVEFHGGTALRVALQEPHARMHARVLPRQRLEGEEALALAGVSERRRRALQLRHVPCILLCKPCMLMQASSGRST